MAKEHQYADVQAMLYIALFLTKSDEQKKTEKMLDKFLDKDISAKQIYDKLFKKQNGGAKKKPLKKKIKVKYVKVNDKYYKKYENGRRIRTTKKTYLKYHPKKK